VRVIHFLILGLALAAGGCKLGPSKKQHQALHSLRIEATTRTEARKLFGKPWGSAEGEWRVDMYQLGRHQLDREGFSPGHLVNHGDIIDLTMLYLVFNTSDVLQKTNVHRWAAKGKVKSFLLNRVGNEFNTADQKRIIPGRTKLQDLEAWFGPPVLLGPDERGGTTAAWFCTLHAYGGMVDMFEHQNLWVRLNDDQTVETFSLRGKLKAPKEKKTNSEPAEVSR
jgi:hypothetical protein